MPHARITKLAHFILNYRWPILIANALIFLGVFYGMANRGMEFGAHTDYMRHIQQNPLDRDPDHVSPPPIFNADYHVFFDADNPDLIAYDEMQRIYAKDENLIIVIVAKNGDVFTNENLESIKKLTRDAWTVPYVNRVDGLANFNYTYVDGDDLLVESFIDHLPLDESEMAAKKQLALNDPLMPKFLISKEADITQIQLKVIIPPAFPEGFMEARRGVEAIAEAVRAENPNLEIRLGGTVMLNTAFQDFAEQDLKNLFPLMFIFIIVVIATLIRSFWGTALPMLLLALSVMFPIFLFVGVMSFSLTNVTMNVVQMLLAIAIADAIHVLTVFFRGLRNGLDKRHAMLYTVEKNFIPCLITSVTTAIGFFSLVFQTIPPFRDLGMFAGVGTVYAFILSLFALPAFLSLIPFKKREVDVQQIKEYEKTGYEWLTNFIFKYQKGIRWFALVTSVIGLYYIFTINVDNIPIRYFAEHTEFRRATEYIDQSIIGVNPIEFNFDSGEDNGIYDPAYLRRIEQFTNFVEGHPEYKITYVSSIVDIIKRINKTLHGDDPAYYKIPEENEVTAEGDTINAKSLIAQYLLLYQMSLPQGMELTNQIDISNSSTRVTAFMQTYSSWKQTESADALTDWIALEMPDVDARALGVPVMFGKLMKIAIPGMLQSLLISIIMITIVLTITFKSVKIGFYSMIPNIWPLIFVFGGIGLFGVTVNMSVAVIGMITLGIAVDDTVHYLSKYLRGLDEGYGRHDSILYAFRQVGAPLFFTSLILIVGFGSLFYSDFVLNSDLAIYCSSVIALALVADFLLLPAVILKFDKSNHSHVHLEASEEEEAQLAE
ncbi:MAG: MMPL family transporter [Calditrichaeota bacterium]|nr:MMPL family transporter [Calditrichota bacterium]